MPTAKDSVAGTSTTQHVGPVVPEVKLPDDAEKKINDPKMQELTAKQVARAAVEAFQISSPQPTANEVDAVIESLTETDDKGELKQKFSKAIDAAKAAVAKANELRKAA